MSTPNPYTQESTIESAHNIDENWEALTGQPIYLAWTINHILGMLQLGSPKLKATAHQLRHTFMSTISVHPHQAHALRDDFLNGLLKHFLQSTLESVHGTTGVPRLIRKMRVMLKAKKTNGWDVLLTQLKEARIKVDAVSNRSHRDTLHFALSAAMTITVSQLSAKNPDSLPTQSAYAVKLRSATVVANVLRDTVNAQECLNIYTRGQNYISIAEYLLFLLAGKKKPTPCYKSPSMEQVALNLLERLGTYTSQPA